MYRLSYISTAADSVGDGQVTDIVETAREKNGSSGITGLLLFNGLNFLQLIEGERREVEDLYTRILADRRHSSVTTMLHEPADARIFADWAMGFSYVRPNGGPGAETSDDYANLASHEMPDHVRKLFGGFSTLRGI